MTLLQNKNTRFEINQNCSTNKAESGDENTSDSHGRNGTPNI